MQRLILDAKQAVALGLDCTNGVVEVTIRVDRHKAARRRKGLSLPIQAAIARELLTPADTHFDYGCGYGDDVRHLQEMGYQSLGYDPHYFPHTPIVPADVVSLSYVLSVIESPREREQVLVRAYELSQKYLIAAAITTHRGKAPYNDGKVTHCNTFTKPYRCTEFRQYLECILGIEAIPLATGCYALPRTNVRPLLLYSLEPQQRSRLIASYEQQLTQLQSEYIAPDDANIERYQRGNYRYYRLRSPQRNLPGKHGHCKLLHLGSLESERYQWATGAITRRTQLRLLQLRLDALRAM